MAEGLRVRVSCVRRTLGDQRLVSRGGVMARRGKMASGHSKRVFRNTARGTHRKNVARVMRGGIRL